MKITSNGQAEYLRTVSYILRVPTNSDDPFDCKFDYSFDASVEDAKKYLRRVVRRNSPNWNRKQREAWIAKHLKMFRGEDPIFVENLKRAAEHLLSEIGIYSLSRVPDDILMWSHYANCHQGFCIKFFDDTKDWFIARAQVISYSDAYPIVNPIMDDDFIRLEKTLLTKAKHWEYEKEWRIIDYENGPGVKRFPPHLLVGVIFGCKMTEEHQALVRDWCENRQPEVSFYRAQEAAQTYSLELIEVK